MRLIRDNVEREAATEAQAEALRKMGYQDAGPVSAAEPEMQEIETQEPDLPELAELTTKQLKELAASRGMTGTAALSRAELLRVLEGSE